jgi:two-component system, chemotaxis family, CheB/CheR fusion protein
VVEESDARAVSEPSEELAGPEAGSVEPPTAPHPSPFPIVGIGASAGGLEAFGEFLSHMPADSGIAFVIVQHLSPPHRSVLAELLRRYTAMTVEEAEDGMPVAPNTVHIIPPGLYLSLEDGHLRLSRPTGGRGPRNTIDLFFRTLASSQGDRAIGIVLSGTGTDGTLGVRAIKGEAGMVMVQDPATAAYDGMPSSVVATGLADYVLPAADMPERLMQYVGDEQRTAPATQLAAASDPLQRLLALIRSRTGNDFSHYKTSSLVRRIQRRMALRQVPRLVDYLTLAREDGAEVKALFRELLIGVTSFFRDPEAFAALRDEALPRVLSGHPEDEWLRVWVPACSTGEEAYSLAIIVREYLESIGRDMRMQIFATDVDARAIDTARSATYPENIAIDVSPERLARFFHREGQQYRVAKGVRDTVVFAVQNALQDPPFSRMDLISCRNLLIYLDGEAQSRLLQVFHYSLVDGGVLFLGSSETLGDSAAAFTTVDAKWRLYARRGAGRPQAAPTAGAAAPSTGANGPAPRAAGYPVPDLSRPPRVDIRQLAQKSLLDSYAPPAVIVDEGGNAVYFHGHTGKYLEPAPGEATQNVVSMAREGIAERLAGTLPAVLREHRRLVLDDVRVRHEGGYQALRIIMKPLVVPGAAQGMALITFEDVADTGPAAGAEQPEEQAGPRNAQLALELEATRESLKNTIGELGTANEELQSTNEELQSANEELQSSNEELETSKEELQSLNEELHTVNAELSGKIDELSQANDDLANFLNSTEIGSVYLDTELRVKRYTPAMTAAFSLIPSDVGRPITDIRSHLVYDRLAEDVGSVLKTLKAVDRQVQAAGGRRYAMSILPYRTLDSLIDGVVITLTDVTEHVALRDRTLALAAAAESGLDAVLLVDDHGVVRYANPAASRFTGRSRGELEGVSLADVGWTTEGARTYEQVWQAVTADGGWHGRLTGVKPDGSLYVLEAAVLSVRSEADGMDQVVVTGQEVSTVEALQGQLEETRRLAARLLSGDAAVAVVDRSGRLLYASDRYRELVGSPERGATERAHQTLVWRAPGADTPLPPKEGPLWRALAGAAAIDGERFDVEVAATGAHAAVKVSTLPVRAADGQLDRVVVAIERADGDARAGEGSR